MSNHHSKQVIEWFEDGHQGIGVVTGFNNLECLKLKAEQLPASYISRQKEIAEASGLGDLWELINTGYVEQSPSGGIHWLYRISDAPDEFPGNTKIASRPGETVVLKYWLRLGGNHGFHHHSTKQRINTPIGQTLGDDCWLTGDNSKHHNGRAPTVA
jgi:hypothetical protein